jgi:DNA-binding transcriptional LysR family regulator
MNTADVDLNLLHAFQAVHAAGSVTRAAERLGVSQPTVSHALKRLRRLYRDPLFVRTQGGMAPTAKADRLAEAVRQALHVLDVAIQEGVRYDPAASDRTFRLHMSDIGETVFLPRLLHVLAKQAPNIRLETYQFDDKDIGPALESGRIDLAVGYIPALSEVEQTPLLSEHYVVLMRSGHPLASRAPTRAALAKLRYAVVRSHGATARALKDLGLSANIRLSMPHFLVLPRILAETDLAVVMPARLAEVFCAMGDYATWRPRVNPKAFDVSLHWSWRYAGDPGMRWLRELIVTLFGEKRRSPSGGAQVAARNNATYS